MYGICPLHLVYLAGKCRQTYLMYPNVDAYGISPAIFADCVVTIPSNFSEVNDKSEMVITSWLEDEFPLLDRGTEVFVYHQFSGLKLAVSFTGFAIIT